MLDVTHNEILGINVTHAFLQENLEVLPLNGRRVLELINHHVLQLSANLLKDERGVAVLNERMEQLLGIAEQKAVGLAVHLTNLLFNTP